LRRQRASRNGEAVVGIGQRWEWGPFEPSPQFRSVTKENRNEFIIFDRPQTLIDVHFPHKAEVCHELANSNIRRKFQELGQ